MRGAAARARAGPRAGDPSQRRGAGSHERVERAAARRERAHAALPRVRRQHARRGGPGALPCMRSVVHPGRKSQRRPRMPPLAAGRGRALHRELEQMGVPARSAEPRGGGSWGRWRAALAARQVLAFVAAHTAAGAAQLAGNSVHVDAAFLRRRMPRLAAHMHHRIVDVSTVMELCRRWYPRAFYRAPKMQVRAALATARRRARMRPAVRLLVSCFRVLVHRQRLVLLAPRLPWKPECLVLVRHASTGHGATQCEFRARACADVVVRACRRLRTRRGQTSARAWSSCGTTESTCSGGRPDAARSALHLCCAVLSCLTETAPCMTRVRGPTLQLCRVAQRACHYSGAAPVQATPSRRARQDTLPSHPPRCAVGTSPLSSQPHRLQ